MTLDELIAALLQHRTQNPEHGTKQVATEGCDCYGDATGVHYSQMLDGVLIERTAEFDWPTLATKGTHIPPTPIRPRKLKGYKEFG